MKKTGWICIVILGLIFFNQPVQAQVQINYDVFDNPPVNNTSGDFLLFCRNLSMTPIIKGGFILTKYEKGKMKDELESGSFIVQGRKGVVLNNFLPKTFKVTLVENEFTFVTTRGFVFNLNGNKTMNGIFYSLKSIFDNDPAALLENFETYFTESNGSWTLGVIPRDKTIRYFINRFIIIGDTDIRTVYVLKKNGDIMEYLLVNHSYPDSLTAEESALFELK